MNRVQRIAKALGCRRRESPSGAAAAPECHAGAERRCAVRRLRSDLRAGRTVLQLAIRRTGFQRRIRPLLQELRTAQIGLSALAEDVERRFLRCGEALRTEASLAAEIAAENRHLLSFDAAVTGGEAALARVAEGIRQKLSLSDHFAREIGKLAATLDRHNDRLAQLVRHQALLERSFAPLSVLRSLFRIESARLAPELRNLFSAVTLDMTRLEDVARECLAEQTRTLADARQRIEATAAQLRERARQQAVESAELQRQVDEALTVLDGELAKARARNALIERALAQIDHEIGSATVSLQYQDITRQKMAHTDAALDDLVHGLEIRPERAHFDEHVGTQRLRCELQVLQLTATRTELENATHSVDAGLRGILGQLQHIERESLSRSDLDDVVRAMDAAVDQAAQVNRRAADAIEQALAGLGDSIAATRQLAANTAEATTSIGRLAFDIRLMGLNAEIQAVQVHHGGLEVLSGAAATVSMEAIAASNALEEELGRATFELHRILEASGVFHAATRDQHRALQAEQERLAGALDAEHAANRAALRRLGSLLARLREDTDTLLSAVTLSHATTAALDDAVACLGRVVGVCEAACAQPAGDRSRGLLSAEAGRYTMESERAVHTGLVRAEQSGAAAPVPAEPLAQAPVIIGAAAGKGVPNASEGPREDPPEGAGLGANVELF